MNIFFAVFYSEWQVDEEQNCVSNVKFDFETNLATQNYGFNGIHFSSFLLVEHFLFLHCKFIIFQRRHKMEQNRTRKKRKIVPNISMFSWRYCQNLFQRNCIKMHHKSLFIERMNQNQLNLSFNDDFTLSSFFDLKKTSRI